MVAVQRSCAALVEATRESLILTVCARLPGFLSIYSNAQPAPSRGLQGAASNRFPPCLLVLLVVAPTYQLRLSCLREVMAVLIKAGANVNYAKRDGWTALMLAVNNDKM